MSSEGSVSKWIVGVKEGDPNSEEALWARYYSQIVDLARRKMTRRPQLKNEEDIAVSVFAKFFAAAKSGRLRHLTDRDGLWRLLFKITQRKLTDSYRYETRTKRQPSNGKTVSLDELDCGQVAGGRVPAPEFAALMAEELQQLLDSLPTERSQNVVILKLAGATNEEIADELGCTVRTVERTFQRIRDSYDGE